MSRWVAGADRALERLVGARLTPFVGLLAVVLALALGAGARRATRVTARPVMAAYLSRPTGPTARRARRRRDRDADAHRRRTRPWPAAHHCRRLQRARSCSAGSASRAASLSPPSAPPCSRRPSVAARLATSTTATTTSHDSHDHHHGHHRPPRPPRPQPQPRPPPAPGRTGSAARPRRHGCRRRASAEPIRARRSAGRDRAGAHRVRGAARDRLRRRDGRYAHGRRPATDPASRPLFQRGPAGR